MKKSEFAQMFCANCEDAYRCSEGYKDRCNAYDMCEDDDLMGPVNTIVNQLHYLANAIKKAPFHCNDASVYNGAMYVTVEFPETIEAIAKTFQVEVGKNSVEVGTWVANVHFVADRKEK